MTPASFLLATVVAVAQAASPAAPGALRGTWEGVLALPGGQSLRIVFHVADDGTTTLDSPDQGARGVPAQSSQDGSTVRFGVPAIGGRFEGVLSGDGRTVTGALSQGGATLPLILTRTAERVSDAGPNRPQTPQPPFPYASEEVVIDNPAAPGVSLAATLTLPTGPGPHPAAILITGSGPQDRDETIFDHKLFLVLADALTRRGVAVLRYDDRGVAGSTGDFGAATTADFATDARAALDWLAARPDIDAARIGLIGHSEGGTIAPLVVQDGGRAAWLILLAGTTVPGGDIIEAQAHLIAQAAGATPDQLAQAGRLQAALMQAIRDHADDAAGAARALEALLVEAGQPQVQAAQTAAVMSSDWYRGFIVHDPAASIRAADVPVLGVYGGRDLQVPADQNAPVLQALNPQAEIRIFPQANHLLQPATTGLPSEYDQIETTIDPEILSAVVDWAAARSGL